MIRRPGVLFLAVISTLGCESNESPRVVKRGVHIKFDFEAAPSKYADGFLCFIAFTRSGSVEVPIRYELAPRKGFMDAVYLQNRAQDPPFWAQPRPPSQYERVGFLQAITLDVALPVEGMLVGHRTREEKEWAIVRIPINSTAFGKDPIWKVDLRVSSLMDPGSAVSESDRTAAAAALDKAEKETTAILNRER
ncbi:MAG TPA: hypothetical protein VNM14_03385 [Planctomycetota bacterium]|nr:hypothetical protein [Planctomycetota bacterium]